LPWNLLYNIIALLASSRRTLPGTNVGALFVINILRHGYWSVVTNLLGDIIANLARFIDIVANLLGNRLTDIPLMSGALTVIDFLGMDLGNKRANTSGLLLAVS